MYLLSPFVAGAIGDATEVLNQTAIDEGTQSVPEIGFLEYEINVWFGDELLEAYPCFVISSGLFQSIQRAELTGVSSGPVRIAIDSQVEPVPNVGGFVRLIPNGRIELEESGDELEGRRSSGHDFMLSQDHRLVVTSEALDVLRKHNIENCGIRRVSVLDEIA